MDTNVDLTESESEPGRQDDLQTASSGWSWSGHHGEEDIFPQLTWQKQHSYQVNIDSIIHHKQLRVCLQLTLLFWIIQLFNYWIIFHFIHGPVCCVIVINVDNFGLSNSVSVLCFFKWTRWKVLAWIDMDELACKDYRFRVLMIHCGCHKSNLCAF